MATTGQQKRARSKDPAESGGLSNIPDEDLPNEQLSPLLDWRDHSKRQQISGGLSWALDLVGLCSATFA